MELTRHIIHTNKQQQALNLTPQLIALMKELVTAYDVDLSSIAREAIYSYLLREYPKAQAILKDRAKKEAQASQYIPDFEQSPLADFPQD